MMNKVTMNIRRTTVQRIGATLKRGDYFHYCIAENRFVDGSGIEGSGINLCITDGKECVNLYTGEVIDILADWPIELVRNITIEGDV